MVAANAFKVYSIEGPVFRVVNQILNKQEFEDYSYMFPLVNTISCGLVNFEETSSEFIKLDQTRTIV